MNIVEILSFLCGWKSVMVSLSVSISKDKEYYLTIAGCEVCFEMVKSQVYKGLYKVKAIIEFFSIDNIAQY